MLASIELVVNRWQGSRIERKLATAFVGCYSKRKFLGKRPIPPASRVHRDFLK
jgi:hypothetical protein